MKKNLYVLLSLVVVLLGIGVVNLDGQTSVRLSADIPFEFIVGEKSLPAGTYTVGSLGNVAGTILVRNVETYDAAIVLVSGVSSSAFTREGKLIFNRYGRVHFLSQVWANGENSGSQLPKTHQEQELAMNPPSPGNNTQVVLRAQR